MGNYYEGSFFVKFRNMSDSLEKVLNSLKDEDSKYIDDYPLFDSKHDYKCLGIESGILLYLKDDAFERIKAEMGLEDVPDDDRYLDLSSESYNELLEEDPNIEKDYEKRGYWVSARVCTKRYNKELELFLDYLRPCLDKDMNSLIVGHIADEDGHCDKDLYIDNEKFEEILKSREYLCSGCDCKKDDCLCNLFSVCERAYNLGAKNKET